MSSAVASRRRPPVRDQRAHPPPLMEGVPIPQPAARFLRFLVGAKISPITVMETLAK